MQNRIDTRVTISDKETIARILKYQDSIRNSIGVKLSTNDVIRSLVLSGLSNFDQGNGEKMSAKERESA